MLSLARHCLPARSRACETTLTGGSRALVMRMIATGMLSCPTGCRSSRDATACRRPASYHGVAWRRWPGCRLHPAGGSTVSAVWTNRATAGVCARSGFHCRVYGTSTSGWSGLIMSSRAVADGGGYGGGSSCSTGRVGSRSPCRCRSAAAWELRGRDNESGLVPALRPEFSAGELRHFETAPRPRSLVVLLRAHGTPCVRRRSTVRARGVGARWQAARR